MLSISWPLSQPRLSSVLLRKTVLEGDTARVSYGGRSLCLLFLGSPARALADLCKGKAPGPALQPLRAGGAHPLFDATTVNSEFNGLRKQLQQGAVPPQPSCSASFRSSCGPWRGRGGSGRAPPRPPEHPWLEVRAPVWPTTLSGAELRVRRRGKAAAQARPQPFSRLNAERGLGGLSGSLAEGVSTRQPRGDAQGPPLPAAVPPPPPQQHAGFRRGCRRMLSGRAQGLENMS